MLDSLKTKIIVGILGLLLILMAWWRMEKSPQVIAIAQPKLNIQHWQSEQGSKIIFVENHQLPLVDMQLLFPGGAAFDGQCYGMGNLTALMLDEGIEGKDANAIAATFEGLGAEYGAFVNHDTVSISLRTMRHDKYFKPAVALFHKIISEPTFPEASLDRIKRNLLREHEMMTQQAPFVASEAYLQALYGSQPYGHRPIGNKACLETVHSDSVKAFYRKHYIANHGVLAIVGDLSLSEAKHLAEQVLRGLDVGEKQDLAVSSQTMKTGRQHIDFPSTQTTVLLGQVAIPRNHPDYFPLLVGNHILGGGMNSRLFKSVREKGGLAYHVSSGFSPKLLPGPFTVKFSTRNDKAEEALALAKSELTDFIQAGITTDELQSAKRYLSQHYIFSLGSNRQLVSVLASMVFYALPLDYLQNYATSINRVTVSQVNEAFQKHLDTRHMAIVSVGGK